MSNKCRCNDCSPKRGDRGLTGPAGPQGPAGPAGPGGTLLEVNVVGEDDIVVTESVVSGVQTFTVAHPKEFFYDDTVQPTDISLDPSFAPLQYFSPVGYTNLSYTNTSTVSKTYKIHASYEHRAGSLTSNSAQFSSWVDAALVKTGATILYESLGRLSLSGFLFWGPATYEIIGSGTPAHELLDDQGDEVQFRFLQTQIPMRSAFFYSVTLAAGETVTLMFQTKDSTASALLLKAQLMVEEV